jgi:hypothetical protein
MGTTRKKRKRLSVNAKKPSAKPRKDGRRSTVKWRKNERK